MKKVAIFVLLLLVVTMCIILPVLAGEKVSEPAYLWDIPFGIPCKEAAAQLSQKLGVPFEKPNPDFDYFESAEPCLIQGLLCDVSVTASKDTSNYSSLVIYNRTDCDSANQQDIDYFMLYYPQTAMKFVKMLEDKFGAAPYARLVIENRNKGETNYLSFDIPMDGNNIEPALFEKNTEDHSALLFVWENATLTAMLANDISETKYSTIYLETSPNLLSMLSDDFDSYLGNCFEYLENQKVGVSSF